MVAADDASEGQVTAMLDFDILVALVYMHEQVLFIRAPRCHPFM
jgi:hypothetical protein